MALNVSAWSIRNPVPAVVLFAVLMLLGWVSFESLPITKFPNIDVPVVSVTITQSGAAPAELETQVTRRIEDAVSSVTGVKHVSSTVTDGTSVTAIEFWLEVNSDRALNDVKDAVTKIRGDLPASIDEPRVGRVDVEGQSILTYSAASPGLTLEQLSWHVDDVAIRALQGLKGVGRVDRIGGVSREIRVSLDPDRLMALGVTAADVNRQIKAISVDMAGGKGDVGSQEQAIRTLAAARSLDDLKATKMVLPGGREIRLGEIAQVTDAYEEQKSFARLDGTTPIVAFSVFRAKGASDTEVAARVAATIARLGTAHPDIAYRMVDDGVSNTYGNFTSAMQTLIEGAVLATIVVFLFLRDWRATLIAALALPLSAVPAFWIMSMLGFSLNLVSLLAITLMTGILVDDAIVEIENIVRHMKMGKSPYRASIEAADEIGLAVIAISMTIVAIFAPVSFMGGVAGQYFKQFGLVVAGAVLVSLMVARLITPMLTAYFLRPHAHVEPQDGLVMRAYTSLLNMTLRRWTWRLPLGRGRRLVVHPTAAYLTVAVGLVLFVASMSLTSLLPQGFIPPDDSGRMVLSVELPPGVRLADTQAKTDEVVRAIRKAPEVTRVLVIGGSGPTGTLELRRSTVIVQLKPKHERDRHQWDVKAEITKNLAAVPDIRAWSVNDRGDRDVTLALMSSDPVELSRAVDHLQAAMRRVPGFTNVAASAGLDRPEVQIKPRLDEAARYGITTAAISEAVRVATIGDLNANLAKFDAGDRQIPIRVQLTEHSRADLHLIESLNLTTPSGGTVPLSAVADVTFGQGPSSIDRYDRVRRVTIGTDLPPSIVSGTALDTIYALPEAKSFPSSVHLQTTGDAEIQGEVFGGFAYAMGLGLLMVLGVLILLFRSVFQPITILLSLPLSVGGVIGALLLTNNAVSMPVVIGILMLMGIVTKNAIMLVDFTVERRAHGLSRGEALIDAGRKRARPIVMTTIAMVAGMLPSAFGHGDGGEFRAPMAIAVIGGLTVATLLSLVFVPSFYVVMDDISRFFAWLLGRFVGPRDEEPQGRAIVPAE